jgi:hypothetical protein
LGSPDLGYSPEQMTLPEAYVVTQCCHASKVTPTICAPKQCLHGVRRHQAPPLSGLARGFPRSSTKLPL